jgi:hypothetical protein
MELENIMLSEVRFRKKVACFLIMWKIDPKANISIIIYTYIYRMSKSVTVKGDGGGREGQ